MTFYEYIMQAKEALINAQKQLPNGDDPYDQIGDLIFSILDITGDTP